MVKDAFFMALFGLVVIAAIAGALVVYTLMEARANQQRARQRAAAGVPRTLHQRPRPT